MTFKEKALDISMLLGTATAILTALFANFARECDGLCESTFRLHILANSDSAEDQRLKYALRDYILSDLGDIFSSCSSEEGARETAKRELPYIGERANEYLQSVGYPYTATCTVENTAFPTRVYGDITLPAGNYDALRIEIGSGGGRNWWCVLYPSVCLNAASVPETPFPRRELYEQRKAADRSTADSVRGTIEFRFALYELLKKAVGGNSEQ